MTIGLLGQLPRQGGDPTEGQAPKGFQHLHLRRFLEEGSGAQERAGELLPY